MGLETASYLNDLVAANPDGAADQVSQGDNHIRLLKAVLQATFPSMAGAAWRVQTKTANYTLLATDNMSVINCTTALTLALTDVATIGNKFMALVSANGVAVTIDPSGTETVNGAATLVIPSGQACLLVCTGAAWLAYGLTEAAGAFPTGTKMLFQQTAAPTGWTKDTTHNDKALRVVSGTASSGGTSAFSTVFGKTATDSAAADLAAHSHGVTDPGHVHTFSGHTGSEGSGTYPTTPGLSSWSNVTYSSAISSAGTGISVNPAGTGAGHAHGMDIRVQYVDLIIATKN